ncbi:unnamed protein product, partial [Prorocentrum cordatum]
MHGLDDVDAARPWQQIAGVSNLAFASLVCPWMHDLHDRAGATLEDFRTWTRDDILPLALPRPDCKRYWLEHDTPIGCHLPLSPEAGGDSRASDPADARQQYHEELRQRLDFALASFAPYNAEQQTIFQHIRQARAYDVASKHDKYRDLNDVMWAHLGDYLLAYVKQRHYRFNRLMGEMNPMFSCRGIAVLPVDQWIETQERPYTNAWHLLKTDHNLVQLTQQFMHPATLRNPITVPLSLPTQPFPFRHPLIMPVNEYQSHTQAEEMRGAFRMRLEQPTQFQREKSFAALQVKALGEHELATWMNQTFQ